MRDSMVFYRSFMEAMENLDSENYKCAMQGIMRYAMDGEEPDLTGAAKMAFLFMKPQIDSNNRKYENGKRGAEYGKRGGRPKKETPAGDIKTPEKPQENPSETPKRENETPNVYVYEYVNDNEKHKEHIDRKRTKPTVEEIITYIRGLQNAPQNPEQTANAFFDYFESNGWRVGGKAPMKDWKAAVRNWIRNEKTFRKGEKPLTRFHNFEPRENENIDSESVELSMRALGI